jgi:hypothetical protein
MATSNKSSPTALNVDELTLLIDGANASLRATKDSAKKAAAYVYMVHLRTSSGHAKKWLADKISDRNKDIDQKNADLKALSERAKNFMDGKITNAEDLVNLKPKDAADKKLQDEEIAKLKFHAALGDKERSAMKLMRVEAREGTSPFTEIIKYVFDITSKRELDAVNRYAHALEWIKSKFTDSDPADIDEICAAIDSFGGFEAVVQHQRLLPSEPTETEEDRAAISKFILSQQKEGLKSVHALGDVALQSEKALGAPILLLGRYMGGKVEIVGEANMTDTDLDRAVNNFAGIGSFPVEPETEFVGRVLDLGQIVEEGQEGTETYDGTSAGVKVKSQRVLSLLTEQERPKFVVSARDAETGVIIHAFPKTAGKLIAANQNVTLTSKQLRSVSEMLSNEAKRRLISLSAIADPKTASGKPSESPMAWKAVNVALVSANRQSDEDGQKIMWTSMANVRERALDIDGFRPNVKFSLPKTEIETMFASLLKPWIDSKDGKKNQKPMRCVVTAQDVTFSMPDANEHKAAVPASVAGGVTVAFRIKDVLALAKKLKDQKVDSFEFSIDDGGLLAVSWADDVGTYAVHVPTVGKDGKLQSRRVSPMRATMPVAIAAE